MGTNTAISAVSSAPGVTALSIGGTGNVGRLFHGDLLELRAYNTQLSNTARATVEADLFNHWFEAPEPIVLGDFNRDGHVDAADVTAMEQALADLPAYQTAKGLAALQLLLVGDVNGDGVVNNADMQSLLNVLKSGGGSTDPVPEPASIALLGLGALAITARRRLR